MLQSDKYEMKADAADTYMAAARDVRPMLGVETDLMASKVSNSIKLLLEGCNYFNSESSSSVISYMNRQFHIYKLQLFFLEK